MLTAREWRKLRDQAGKLQFIIAEIQETRPTQLPEAEKVYKLWLHGKITYSEAEKRLKKLAAKAKTQA